ncbi:MAG: Spy/CpxP family protein refolding chaperone [Candidatus Omnitrophica bacterium]|nr:Spy/CpxP family protein refolding chaperone [Candidatus Omnitrophota bacterium]MDD5488009.1 Spy/CpxP family protein refolding chaperone [Candidatus Omnitrophota bacterium]
MRDGLMNAAAVLVISLSCAIMGHASEAGPEGDITGCPVSAETRTASFNTRSSGMPIPLQYQRLIDVLTSKREDLALTKEQENTITAVLEGSRKRSNDLDKEINETSMEIDTILLSGEYEPDVVNMMVEKKFDLIKEKSQYLIMEQDKIYRVLNDEQRSVLVGEIKAVDKRTRRGFRPVNFGEQ